MDGPTISGIAIPANRYTASKPVRDRQYLAFIRSLPCLVCARTGVEAAECRSLDYVIDAYVDYLGAEEYGSRGHGWCVIGCVTEEL